MIKNEKLKEVLSELDGRINHVEDVTEDSKELLIQLVKQNNAIIKFLSSLEIEEIINPSEEELMSLNVADNSTKMRDMYELINIFSEENEDLKDLEKELKKHKSEINKNVIGEA